MAGSEDDPGGAYGENLRDEAGVLDEMMAEFVNYHTKIRRRDTRQLTRKLDSFGTIGNGFELILPMPIVAVQLLRKEVMWEYVRSP